MPVVTVLHDNKERSTVQCEGFIHNFDDRAGLWTIWSIANMALTVSTSNDISLVRDGMQVKDILIFQKRQIMKVNPEVYYYGSRPGFRFHVTYQVETGEPGSTSYIWTLSLKDASSGTVLVERAVKGVCVDRKTRKPVPVPESFREKHFGKRKLHNLSDEFTKKSGVMEIPDNCYKWLTRIRYSDLDRNMHTNQSVYIKLCIDGATSAALNRKLKHFNADMCFYPAELLDITFYDECVPEDDLIVNLWQDSTDISLLNFVITKSSKPITYANCKFSLQKISPEKSNL